jgi:hypothetical protein
MRYVRRRRWKPLIQKYSTIWGEKWMITTFDRAKGEIVLSEIEENSLFDSLVEEINLTIKNWHTFNNGLKGEDF